MKISVAKQKLRISKCHTNKVELIPVTIAPCAMCAVASIAWSYHILDIPSQLVVQWEILLSMRNEGHLGGKWIDLTLHHNISIYSNTSSRRYNLLWLRHNSNKHLSLGAWPQGQRLFLVSKMKQVDWGEIAFNLDNWGMGTSPFILWGSP